MPDAPLDRLVAADREFAPGDRIVCLRNDARTGVQNGTRGTIKKVIDAQALIVRTDTGTTVQLQPEYLAAGHVRHGYAITGHAAQGSTVERAFVLGESRRALQEWGYVSLSRASVETRSYLAEADLATVDAAEPAAERFGTALARTSNERLASEIGI